MKLREEHESALALLRASPEGVVPDTVTLASLFEDLVMWGLADRHEGPRYSWWTSREGI
jgi:hypothetical protein